VSSGRYGRSRSPELLRVEAGSLYPALHRLEPQGWLKSNWKVSDKGQRAKYYRLTPSGKKQLAAEQGKWERFVRAIRLVMRPAER
jgi:PadR family transcriptional regulator PadR